MIYSHPIGTKSNTIAPTSHHLTTIPPTSTSSPPIPNTTTTMKKVKINKEKKIKQTHETNPATQQQPMEQIQHIEHHRTNSSPANMTRGDKHPQSQPMEQIATSRTATQDNTSDICRRRWRKMPPPTYR
jgi:hypothetical protein